MKSIKRIKCRHCGKLFTPDARNVGRQKYCSTPNCRKASIAASQKKWLSKPENQDYFSGPDNVRRVQQWRQENPGYSQRKSSKEKEALQDPLMAQAFENKGDNAQNVASALQDSLITQPAVLLGLIARLTGGALQDDIARTIFSLQQLGLDILNRSPQDKGEKNYDHQKTDFTPPGATGPQELQLDRSSSGPGGPP